MPDDTNNSIPPELSILSQIAESCGGKITELSGPLPDGSGFAIMSMPLPANHWIYQGDRIETYGVFNIPPMPFHMGTLDQASLLIQRRSNPTPFGIDPPIRMSKEDFANKIANVARYAIRSATMNGKEMDFDPDAMVQNFQVGMLGYWTDTGLSSDDWANPGEEPWPRK